MKRRKRSGVRVGDRVRLMAGDFGEPWVTVTTICDDMTRCHVRFDHGGWLVVPISLVQGGHEA